MNMGKVVDFDVPKDVVEEVYSALEATKGSGVLRKGTNEATKAVERGIAKLVVIAEDTEPKEIVMHLPMICKEKKIAFVVVPIKQELGAAAGLEVGTAAVAVVEPGRGKAAVEAVVKKVQSLNK